mgnify:CR=1 FL=1
MKDPVSRRSRGFGFITFDDVSGVDRALANEPHTIDNRKVEAKRAVPRSEVSRDAPVPQGGVSAVRLPQPPAPQRTAGAPGGKSSSPVPGAQVNGASSVSVASVGSVASSIDGRSIEAGGDGPSPAAFNKIFVGGLHYDTRDTEFRHYFETYGRVVSAEVMFNRETHKSRGFGFVIFESESAVDAVCAAAEHYINNKLVEVKRAIPRSRLNSGTSSGSPGGSITRSTRASSTGSLGSASAASGGLPGLMSGPLPGASSSGLPPHGPQPPKPQEKEPPRVYPVASYAAALRLGHSNVSTAPEASRMAVPASVGGISKGAHVSREGASSPLSGDSGVPGGTGSGMDLSKHSGGNSVISVENPSSHDGPQFRGMSVPVNAMRQQPEAVIALGGMTGAQQVPSPPAHDGAQARSSSDSDAAADKKRPGAPFSYAQLVRGMPQGKGQHIAAPSAPPTKDNRGDGATATPEPNQCASQQQQQQQKQKPKQKQQQQPRQQQPRQQQQQPRQRQQPPSQLPQLPRQRQ